MGCLAARGSAGCSLRGLLGGLARGGAQGLLRTKALRRLGGASSGAVSVGSQPLASGPLDRAALLVGPPSLAQLVGIAQDLRQSPLRALERLLDGCLRLRQHGGDAAASRLHATRGRGSLSADAGPFTDERLALAGDAGLGELDQLHRATGLVESRPQALLGVSAVGQGARQRGGRFLRVAQGRHGRVGRLPGRRERIRVAP